MTKISLINLPLKQFQTRLGYEFDDEQFLLHALTHRSHSKTHNERLEFLGDSIVNTVVAQQLFTLYPSSPEGDLSAMRSSLVRGETLAEIATAMDVGSVVLLGGGALKTGGQRSLSILADTYEAIIAAIYLDSDWANCEKIIKGHFQGRFDGLENMLNIRDAKSRLQEWLQGRSLALPDYKTIDIIGPGHAQRFKVRCHIETVNGEFVGEGSNRRKAEQLAAEQALKAILDE